MPPRLRTVSAVLLSSAAAGAAIALAVAWLLGGLQSSKTIVQRVSTGQPAASVSASAGRNWISGVYKRYSGGVVQITSTSLGPPDFFGGRQEQRSLGSGFVIDKAGHVVTNYHVVQGAKSVQVSFSNNDEVKADIVGEDPATDIALLKVKEDSRALMPLPLGNSDALQVGDPVVALGNPFGLDRTLTAGVVSALQRQIESPNFSTIDHVIQTDAALNHGNSGGPLLNSRGQVIGVNAQIQTGSSIDQGNVGIGFAIPIDTVKDVVSQLMKEGRVERAQLGVFVSQITPRLSRLFKLPVPRGLIIERVQSGSGAAKAGLKGGTTRVVVAGQTYFLGGDVIVSVDGTPVATPDRLRDLIQNRKPGDEVELGIYRNGARQRVHVQLGRQPAPTPPRS